ncbi:SDR family oxidoreductase [Prochlorococcus sp. MIT 1223]|uniref:SDR family oxidoreductase n=1 Tax=Prochlorococcus sp. MIT 1223 TaxID=3096217 RepID=UPI002A751AC8|nr:SDR family oxidoreductase [Prochlorococcus sp. MIT 1223]
MKVAISGASGKTGYRIAEEAIAKGHEVTLIVRPNSILPKSLEGCRRLNISLFNKQELDDSLNDIEALFIATGARPSIDLTGPAKIDSIAVINQVESCKRVGVKRIILVSSLCAGRWLHPLNLFGLILVWKRIGEKALENSNINWTIIRPGGLNDREEDIQNEGIIYSEKDNQEDGSIPRRLVARCCIDCLKEKKSIGRIIEITSSSQQKKLALGKAI